MSKTKKAIEHAPRKASLTIADVENCVSQLRSLVGEYQSVIAEMKSVGLNSVDVDGAQKFERGVSTLKDFRKVMRVGIIRASND